MDSPLTQSAATSNRRFAVGLAIIVGLFVVLATHAALGNDVTTDEPAHYRYGRRILGGDSERFDDSKMPISAFNAIPCRAWAMFGGPPEDGDEAAPCSLTLARLPTVAMGAVLVAFVGLWARRLFGTMGGLVASGLAGFDPNVLAHSALVTTDIPAALTILVVLHVFVSWLESPSPRRAAVVGLSLGVALCAKYTAAYLVLVLPLSAVAARLCGCRPVPWRTAAASAGLASVLALGVINAGFLFNGTGIALRDQHFESLAFRELRKVPVFSHVPQPLPRPFLQGLDRVWHRERDGGGSGNIYFRGELRDPGSPGFAGYYFVLAFFKSPIGTLLLAALGTVLLGRAIIARSLSLGEIVLLVALGFFSLYFNFIYRAQIGYRFFVVVLPMAFVLAGRVGAWAAPSSVRTALVVGALAANLITADRATPRFLPYFNALVARDRTYELAADSNIDWNQSATAIAAWLEAHPDVRLAPAKPTAGRILVGANQLTGVVTKNRMAWLRASGLKPIDVIEGTHFLFDVPEADAARLLERFPKPNTPAIDPSSLSRD